MIPLAFIGYLVVFYVLPWHRTVLFQWVWVHAPQHFPRCVFLDSHGRVLFNGAFYLEMWLWWLGFLVVGSLVEAASRRDDPAWTSVFGGFARGGLGRAYLLLGFLCVGLVAVALANGYAPHGLLSLGLALLTALLLPAGFPSTRPAAHTRRGKPPGNPADHKLPGDKSPVDAVDPADTLAAEARPLRPEDFPPFAPDAIARRVTQELAAPTMPSASGPPE